MTELNKCIDCGKETAFSARTGQFTQSFICLGCQKKKYEEKEVIVHNAIKILVKREGGI